MKDELVAWTQALSAHLDKVEAVAFVMFYKSDESFSSFCLSLVGR